MDREEAGIKNKENPVFTGFLLTYRD